MNDDLQEKRMAGDYEIIQGLHIGDRGDCSGGKSTG